MIERLTFPVIQAPMAGGIVTPEMVSTISNNGLMGMIPGGYLNLKSLEKFILKVKDKLDDKAIFGLNIFIEEPVNEVKILNKSKSVLLAEKSLVNKEVVNPKFEVPINITEQDYINLIIKHKIPVVSTTFGVFSKNTTQKLRKASVELITTVTSIEEARVSIRLGIRTIIFQGFEAGGHQATFIGNHLNKTSTMNLVKKAKKSFKNIKIIASGGISTENMKDFFKAGADFVQMGSIFMMSDSSGLSISAKKYIQANFVTVVSKKITGRYARGIVSKFQKMDTPKYNFPVEHYHTSFLRKLAKRNNRYEYSSLWIGKNPDNTKIYNLKDLLLLIKSKLS